MNIKKTECENCGKKLQPFEGQTYCQSRWAGRWYAGMDYYDLCKPCYKKWRKEDKKKLLMLAVILVAIILVIVVIGIIFIPK